MQWNDKYANHMWAVLYHIMIEILVSTFHKFEEQSSSCHWALT